MGYSVKLQKITRPNNNTFQLNIPVVLVETMQLEKGEQFLWFLEDKNTLLLKRASPKPARNFKSV